MTTTKPRRKPLPRLPYTVTAEAVSLVVDESVYALEAVYGAAYLFVDRCFVFLTRPAEGKIEVRLAGRETMAPPQLEELVGEFANELLNQALRLQLAASTARIREYYSAAALRVGSQGPTIEEILAELEAEEAGEDPLQILVPWEEKYGDADKSPKDE